MRARAARSARVRGALGAGARRGRALARRLTEVAVQEALAVHVGEREAELREPVEELALRQRLAGGGARRA